MMKVIKSFFSLSEAQEKTIALLNKALEDKNYRICKSEFFYDEGRHLSLVVYIRLAPNLEILVDTLFYNQEFIAFNPQAEKPVRVWAPEISSGKAYRIVLNHFSQILLANEVIEKLEYQAARSSVLDIVKKSI